MACLKQRIWIFINPHLPTLNTTLNPSFEGEGAQIYYKSQSLSKLNIFDFSLVNPNKELIPIKYPEQSFWGWKRLERVFFSVYQKLHLFRLYVFIDYSLETSRSGIIEDKIYLMQIVQH